MTKEVERQLELSDISVFHFKNCYKGDLSFFNGDTEKWELINSKYEDAVKAKGNDLPFELRKQIAIKESTIIILNAHLFMMRNSFESFLNSMNDKYYLDTIDFCADELIKHGIKFNKKNNIIKEHNKCIKLVANKANDIKQDLEHLMKATKGGYTFDKLIAIVGKWTGIGIIDQKKTTMDEFTESYNLMVNGN